jgi:nitrile hydratase accessory protein
MAMAERVAPQASSAFQPSHNFEEPWQADAFATAISLSRAGVFSWSDWVGHFSATIAKHPQLPEETLSQAYFRQWLVCLEEMIERHFGVDENTVGHRQDEWRAAYLATPHGQPVELNNACRVTVPKKQRLTFDAHHDHGHHDHGHHGHSQREPSPKPIVISPASSDFAR